MNPIEKALLLFLLAGCVVIFVLMVAFTYLSTTIYIVRDQPAHIPRTAVELEKVNDSMNNRETRSRWKTKGQKLQIIYK